MNTGDAPAVGDSGTAARGRDPEAYERSELVIAATRCGSYITQPVHHPVSSSRHFRWLEARTTRLRQNSINAPLRIPQ